MTQADLDRLKDFQDLSVTKETLVQLKDFRESRMMKADLE